MGRICKFGKGKVSGGGAGRGRGGGGGNGFEHEWRWIGLREGVCFMDSMVWGGWVREWLVNDGLYCASQVKMKYNWPELEFSEELLLVIFILVQN